MELKIFNVNENLKINRYIADNFVNERVGIEFSDKEYILDARTALEFYEALGKALKE